MSYEDEITDLVIARLETLPKDTAISVGSSGSFTKEEVIKSVREGNEIGKKMIEIELAFLQGLKSGILYGQPSTSN